MNLRENEYAIRKAGVRVSVFEETKFDVNDPSCSVDNSKHIDVSSLVTKMLISLDTRDKHIEKLLKIVEKLESIGVSFRELDEYKQSHLNEWYEYAKWKPVDKDDFLN